MGPVSQATHTVHTSHLPHGLPCKQRRVGPFSIFYFTTFLPAFSAIWRRRYPLFRTLDTGNYPSFLYDNRA